MSESKSAARDHLKYFVLDTNVLLHNPAALFMFADNEVVIPFTVLEEIDRFKRQDGSQPSAENRAVVEDLTGWKYEELWGRGRHRDPTLAGFVRVDGD